MQVATTKDVFVYACVSLCMQTDCENASKRMGKQHVEERYMSSLILTYVTILLVTVGHATTHDAISILLIHAQLIAYLLGLQILTINLTIKTI